jgi:glycosyltransferase involved in cell wall biosynthesis
MNRLVSVVVCCHNMAKELWECLNSLHNQLYDSKEIIVVDDASTDDTREVLAEYQNRLGNSLVVISNPTNAGVAGSRNIGIQDAKGDVIAFTDADCVVEPNWLSELAKEFARERVVAVGGRILDDDCSNIWKLSEKGHNYVAPSEGFVTYVQGCNMAFDAAVLKSFMFNEEIKYGYEEALICDELVKAGYRIWYTPRAVVHHKHRSDLWGLLKQKYGRGYSSIWYRQKQRKFPMLKRHFLMLLSLLLLPVCVLSASAGYVIAVLLAAVIFGLIRDEYRYGAKNTREIWGTLPIVVVSELAHFGGAFAGLFVFHFGWHLSRRGQESSKARRTGHESPKTISATQKSKCTAKGGLREGR